MPKTLDGFLSEDGQSYTSLIEEKDEGVSALFNEDGTPIDDGGEPSKIDDLLGKIKIDDIPEGQRETFKQLTESIKGMKTELDVAKKDSERTALLQQLIERIGQTNKPFSGIETKEEKRERLVDQLKFEDEEKDYYAPHLKMLASALDKLMEGMENVDKRFEENKKSTFVKDVQTFVRTNKIPDKVIKKMDEIAKEVGPGAYNNLERLHKYAKFELGIKDSPPNSGTTNGGERRNIVEFRGKRRSESVMDNKPAKTMQEAWAQAEEALANEA
jgi:hypothetical protein